MSSGYTSPGAIMPTPLRLHVDAILNLLGAGRDVARLRRVCRLFEQIGRSVLGQRGLCVIVAGDQDVVDVFDRTKRSWTHLSPLPLNTTDHTRVIAYQGRILVAAVEAITERSLCVTYDAAASQWVPIHNQTLINGTQCGATLSCRPDGSRLIAIDCRRVQEWLPSTGTWRRLPAQQQPRSFSACQWMPIDGQERLVSVGGRDAKQVSSCACEYLDDDRQAWVALPSLAVGRVFSGSTVWQGRLVVAGGITKVDDVEVSLCNVMVFGPDGWEEFPMIDSQYPQDVFVVDGNVLMMRTVQADHAYEESLWEWMPEVNAWRQHVPPARMYHIGIGANVVVLPAAALNLQ
ncbi:F-box domain-containing protein [Plasmodiophora brassicae]|uniref:F-box domain-containing protein n=1 Tax=Plasmodiophora brassicae TaxID=37360 RepID=A0A0G4ILC9_PLABS|nr:hypothetical protein PBRA_004659 [Plasmodiophora brassicae]SPQ93483.1 unnamed protein product [Plasmodiophora brassicae]